MKGGRYLEAQVQGSKDQAADGTLVILVAGDKSLFDDCQSCFQAMGKFSFHLGEVGNARCGGSDTFFAHISFLGFKTKQASCPVISKPYGDNRLIPSKDTLFCFLTK